jgi:hypothetical protein
MAGALAVATAAVSEAAIPTEKEGGMSVAAQVKRGMEEARARRMERERIINEQLRTPPLQPTARPPEEAERERQANLAKWHEKDRAIAQRQAQERQARAELQQREAKQKAREEKQARLRERDEHKLQELGDVLKSMLRGFATDDDERNARMVVRISGHETIGATAGEYLESLKELERLRQEAIRLTPERAVTQCAQTLTGVEHRLQERSAELRKELGVCATSIDAHNERAAKEKGGEAAAVAREYLRLRCEQEKLKRVSLMDPPAVRAALIKARVEELWRRQSMLGGELRTQLGEFATGDDENNARMTVIVMRRRGVKPIAEEYVQLAEEMERRDELEMLTPAAPPPPREMEEEDRV